MFVCFLSPHPQRDLQAEEAGDSESEWKPDPAAAPHSGPAQSSADPQPVWEPDLRVPLWAGNPEASGPPGPVPQPDPECPLRGVRAAGHRDQPQPEPGTSGLTVHITVQNRKIPNPASYQNPKPTLGLSGPEVRVAPVFDVWTASDGCSVRRDVQGTFGSNIIFTQSL